MTLTIKTQRLEKNKYFRIISMHAGNYKGRIIYFIEGITPEGVHLAGAFGKLTQKRRFVFVTLLILVNVPMS